MSSDTMLMTLIIGLIASPAVSLKGSPTLVSRGLVIFVFLLLRPPAGQTPGKQQEECALQQGCLHCGVTFFSVSATVFSLASVVVLVVTVVLAVAFAETSPWSFAFP